MRIWTLVEQEAIRRVFKDKKEIFWLIPLFDRSTSSYGSGSSSLPPSPPSSLCTGRSSALYFRTHSFHTQKGNCIFCRKAIIVIFMGVIILPPYRPWLQNFSQGSNLLWTRNPGCNDSGTFQSWFPRYLCAIDAAHLISVFQHKQKQRQASCGRMSRDKIEDLVCAPHLSYTQQVGRNISLTVWHVFWYGNSDLWSLKVLHFHNCHLFRLGISFCFTWSAKMLKR